MLMRFARWLLVAPLLLFVVSVAQSSHAEELRIDGFESGELAFIQLGLGLDDILAVRLVPTGPCPCQVTSIKFLLGTSTGNPLLGIMNVRVWDDSGGSRTPGPALFSGQISETSNNDFLFQIDLTSENIIVDGPFRIGLEIVLPEQLFPQIEPSLFRDGDFTITPQQNFVFDANSQTWSYSEDFLLFGDWIIRADVVPPIPAVPLLSGLGIALLICATITAVYFRVRRSPIFRAHT